MTSSNGNLYNKRFENGPNDTVLVGGNGNGDPVTIQYKNCTLWNSLVTIQLTDHHTSKTVKLKSKKLSLYKA